MRLKRLISCLLSAALLAGLLVFPPASASGSGGFSDISDSTVADAAEMLRLLGVVDVSDKIIAEFRQAIKPF